jgi:LmbE family N-acetylglucosaminyl deacetylase
MRITTTDDIKRLGTILGVWAHPDDETFSMGGILAAAVRNGQRVVCITATKGELGVQDENRWPAERLGSIRAKELSDAYQILGITKHYWLDYPDGGCKSADETEAANKIADLIKKFQPDSIFSFGPDGMTGHEDHKASSRWTLLARELAGNYANLYHSIQTEEQYENLKAIDDQFDIFFNIDQPVTCKAETCDICFVLPDDIYALKMQALQAMPSQTEAMLEMFGDYFRQSQGVEAFVKYA